MVCHCSIQDSHGWSCYDAILIILSFQGCLFVCLFYKTLEHPIIGLEGSKELYCLIHY